MLRSLLMISIVLTTVAASAAPHRARAVPRSPNRPAPRCLDLSKKQAEKAVTIAKIALSKGSPLIFQSSKESGLVAPLGLWTEAHKDRRTGKMLYRVKADGRDLDISLVYIARSPKDKKAYNLAWMSGCRPALHKPTAISNQ